MIDEISLGSAKAARLDEAMSAIQITKVPMSVSAAKATDWLASRGVFIGEEPRWE